ncbi:hypothetical protein [Pseudomonas sp. FEN]|nr:hypothetical protein [Pseudomonas sp. FEN]
MKKSPRKCHALCRSQLAGDGRKSSAVIQILRVIVDVHRQQAGAYRGIV